MPKINTQQPSPDAVQNPSGKPLRKSKLKRKDVQTPFDNLRAQHSEPWWKQPWNTFLNCRRDLIRSTVLHIGILCVLSWFVMLGTPPEEFLGTLELSLLAGSSDEGLKKVPLQKVPVPVKKIEKQKPTENPPQMTTTSSGTKQSSHEPTTTNGSGQTAGPMNEFSRRRSQAGGKAGDVTVTLIFDDISDLDLHVYDPASEHIYYRHSHSRSGGHLDVDRNARPPLTDQAVENVVWAKNKAPAGQYRIGVKLFKRRTIGEIPFRVQVQVLNETRIFHGRFPAAFSGRNAAITPVCAVELRTNRDIVWRTPEQVLEQNRQDAAKRRQEEMEAAKFWRRAGSHFRRGRYSEAKRTLKLLVKRWPTSQVGKRARWSLDHWEQELAQRKRRRR